LYEELFKGGVTAARHKEQTSLHWKAQHDACMQMLRVSGKVHRRLSRHVWRGFPLWAVWVVAGELGRSTGMPPSASATPHLTFRQHHKAERMTLNLDWMAAVPHIPCSIRPSNENMAAISPHSDSSSLIALPRCRDTSSSTVPVRSIAFSIQIKTLNTGEGKSMRFSTSSESANPKLGFTWSPLQPSSHPVPRCQISDSAFA
jgi:hypothetical protein